MYRYIPDYYYYVLSTHVGANSIITVSWYGTVQPETAMLPNCTDSSHNLVTGGIYRSATRPAACSSSHTLALFFYTPCLSQRCNPQLIQVIKLA